MHGNALSLHLSSASALSVTANPNPFPCASRPAQTRKTPLFAESCPHRRPKECWEHYFNQCNRARARQNRSCSTCAHDGCCDHYCGGAYWSPESDEKEDLTRKRSRSQSPLALPLTSRRGGPSTRRAGVRLQGRRVRRLCGTPTPRRRCGTSGRRERPRLRTRPSWRVCSR